LTNKRDSQPQGRELFRRIVLTAGGLALTALACSITLPISLSETAGTPVAVVVTPTLIPADMIAQADAEELLLINIYQRVSPAVVNLETSIQGSQGNLIDYASGSGFVYDTEGHIVTNHHMVADADEIRVTFSNGSVFKAEVLGSDPYADLAVLRVDVPAGFPLTPVELGDSSILLVGQRVIAIGNPFGLSGSMTVGIISGVGRTLPSEIITEGGIFSNPFIIQTDAAINPGNSGGPLLDSHGRVIGVNVAIRSETGFNSGVGFAIPVNTVRRVVPQIIETGRVEYPYLGISSQTEVSLSELAIEYDLPVTEGVLIATVAEDSAAEQAGLRGGDQTVTFRGMEIRLGGDIITAIDGTPIHNFNELLGYLVSNTSVGQEIVVTVIRDGETLDVPVTLGARPGN